MGVEIERKFLVVGESWRNAADPTRYRQGYLNSAKHRTVRVRIAGGAAHLTVKGPSTGATRAEFEYAIPVVEAESLLELCETPLIEKLRRRIPFQDLVWEVDEFLGPNRGLVIAEVELEHEDQSIILPDWIGREVTGDPAYFNSNLVNAPYQSWPDQDVVR